MSFSSHSPKSHVKLHTNLQRSSSSKSEVMKKTPGAETLWKVTCDPSSTPLENSKRALWHKDIIKTWRRTCKPSRSSNSPSQWMSVRSCSKPSRPAAITTTALLQIRCRSQWMYGSKQTMACLILQVHLDQQFRDLWMFRRGNTPILFLMEQLGHIRASSIHRKWTQQLSATISKIIAKFLRWLTTYSRI